MGITSQKLCNKHKIRFWLFWSVNSCLICLYVALWCTPLMMPPWSRWVSFLLIRLFEHPLLVCMQTKLYSTISSEWLTFYSCIYLYFLLQCNDILCHWWCFIICILDVVHLVLPIDEKLPTDMNMHYWTTLVFFAWSTRRKVSYVLQHSESLKEYWADLRSPWIFHCGLVTDCTAHIAQTSARKFEQSLKFKKSDCQRTICCFLHNFLWTHGMLNFLQFNCGHFFPTIPCRSVH